MIHEDFVIDQNGILVVNELTQANTEVVSLCGPQQAKKIDLSTIATGISQIKAKQNIMEEALKEIQKFVKDTEKDAKVILFKYN